MTDRNEERSEDFSANPDERLTPPPAPASGLRRAFPVVAAGALYALILVFLVFEARFAPNIVPAEQEIPVEILVDPPAPPPPEDKPPPDPSPATQKTDLETAVDAPRPASDEKVDREAADAKTSQPEPSPKPVEVAKSAAPDAAAVEPSAPAAPVPQEAPKPEAPKLPIFASIPDIDIAGASAETPISGGAAKATYLTILYGMVVAHIHMPPPRPGSSAGLQGAIVFSVDGAGRLVQRKVARSSGYRELDLAALAAVAEASPYPAPPRNAPISLRFTYGAR